MTSEEESYRISYNKATLEVRVDRRERLMYKLFGLGKQFNDEWETVLVDAPVAQVTDYLTQRGDNAWVKVTVT